MSSISRSNQLPSAGHFHTLQPSSFPPLCLFFLLPIHYVHSHHLPLCSHLPRCRSRHHVAVKGANGITGAGMGIDPSTPRDGTRAKPFQQDTSVIRDKEIESGKVGACGRTTQKGAIDMASEMEAAASNGIPSATASGEIQMTLHQVNQDGAGPYTCDISADGGNTFQAAKVTKNVPGAFLGLSTATAEDFPLNVQMPSTVRVVRGGDQRPASWRSWSGQRQVYNRQETDTALAGPDAFADEDAKDAELEAKLISGINKRFVEMEKKRVVRSRVVGGLSGYWI
ncbi:hypothetical protein RHS01_06538 [Rhizoctonia solani]|uniref:Uncharacterized protein n=1 Tax=Rhizoctonia solani TaxID=456999 RepID=A0A8H7IB55_9AGAM|nr:hypothetical protein RHS01_06538 [Rhizoctonia solani]